MVFQRRLFRGEKVASGRSDGPHTGLWKKTVSGQKTPGGHVHLGIPKAIGLAGTEGMLGDVIRNPRAGGGRSELQRVLRNQEERGEQNRP